MLGYDTIQYTHMNDLPCGEMTSEIVWLNNPVKASRKGWFANESCECWLSPDASKNKNIDSDCMRC